MLGLICFISILEGDAFNQAMMEELSSEESVQARIIPNISSLPRNGPTQFSHADLSPSEMQVGNVLLFSRFSFTNQFDF